MSDKENRDTLHSFPGSEYWLPPENEGWLPLTLPSDLNTETVKLVRNFAEAVAFKLRDAQNKYGYSDNWADPTWMDKCRADLKEHLEKGDPRDVAAYCAFLWYHKEPTVKKD